MSDAAATAGGATAAAAAEAKETETLLKVRDRHTPIWQRKGFHVSPTRLLGPEAPRLQAGPDRGALRGQDHRPGQGERVLGPIL